MAEIVDVKHRGLDRAVGAWIGDRVIVDPGPSAGVEHLVAALDGAEPSAILLTHIHLDHAGAAGTLARLYPDLKVYVHEIGAPHMVDPSRLVASSRRVFGDVLDEFGPVEPIDPERVVAVAGGDEVAGMRVLHTPGHAGNHVTYIDESTGDAFVGDVAGVRIDGDPVTLLPTPPPEIDLEAWRESARAVAASGPARLCLTHFGAVDDPAAHLAHLDELFTRYAELARAGDGDAFLEWIDALFAERTEAGDTANAVVGSEMSWDGVARWAQKFPNAQL